MNINKFPRIAIVGGGNMASALASGWLNQGCPATHIHVIELSESLRAQWAALGASVASKADSTLKNFDVWIFAVKPQQMREVVLSTKPFLKPETLVISIAAGMALNSLGNWLGDTDHPFSRIVRCMPNTPALVAAGVTGMTASASLPDTERNTATELLKAVGTVVWVDSDQAIDAVTALSGSGPAYVFLFLESLIAGGVALGLTQDQARQLALSTMSGATRLASESTESPAVLRERVTSKGGTTAAALEVFKINNFSQLIEQAMQAADARAAELSKEFGI